MTALDDFDALTEPDDLDEPCEPPPDADTAARMMRRLRTIAAERAKNGRLAQAELDRVAEWATAVDRPLAAKYEWYERAIAGWARAVNEADRRQKTIRLPFGEVTIRHRQTRVEASTDQEILRRAAHARPDLFRLKFEANKKAITDLAEPGQVVATREDEEVREALVTVADEDGEVGRWVVPGVFVVVPTTDAITVKPEPT